MKLWSFSYFGAFPIVVLFYLSFVSYSNASINDNLQNNQSITSENDYLTYQNETFSFRIDYPSTWIVAENNPELILRVQDVVVNFFSPPQHDSDLFSDNLLVGATKLDENDPTSLEDLPEKYIPVLKELFGVSDPVAFEDVNLDGNPAKKNHIFI